MNKGRHMRRLAILAAAVAALSFATAAGAGTSSATTSFNGETPTAGQTLDVTFTIITTAPVVPYQYALQNTCVYPPTKSSGAFKLGQHDAIATWTDTDALGHPVVTMPVYLQSVPVGSSCKVSLVDRNNVAVKGSTVSYTVS
jgi:hypothetical protein